MGSSGAPSPPQKKNFIVVTLLSRRCPDYLEGDSDFIYLAKFDNLKKKKTLSQTLLKILYYFRIKAHNIDNIENGIVDDIEKAEAEGKRDENFDAWTG